MAPRPMGHAQIRKLRHDLGGDIPRNLSRQLRPATRKAAGPIVTEMRRNASWSTRIPKATRVSTSLAARRPGVRIVVNARRAPHARPYENKGRQGNFRHPVFGNRDVWVAQRARPFFWRAVRNEAPEVRQAVGNTITRVAAMNGFRR